MDVIRFNFFLTFLHIDYLQTNIFCENLLFKFCLGITYYINEN